MIQSIITIFALFVIILANVHTFDEQDLPLSPRQVNTKYGALRGVIIPFKSSPVSSSSSSSSTPSLSPVEAFFGVPYASPPINSLRFMPPVTPSHWRGVKLATKFSPVCPQKFPDISNTTETLKRMSSSRLEHMRRIISFMINQSEDCLYLNIYAPHNSSGSSSSSSSASSSSSSQSNLVAKYPVLVFIHGESYEWGSGNSFDASLLASFGQVIVVTLNYRLGILGFLPAMYEGTVRGNYGLMDQVAALHWIQKNIAEISGDVNNVTIIGHGYGAACVHLLMISPMARGLFSRVILMSGSALSPWAIASDANNYALELADALKCPKYDNVIMVECLRQKRLEEIMSVNQSTPQYLTAFGPIIDGIVVPSDPKHIMQTGINFRPTNFAYTSNSFHYFNSYDLLFGVTRVEAPYIFSDHEERHGIDLSRRDRILRTLVRNLFDFHQQSILLTLINEYTDWNRPVEHPINLLDSTADILGDALIVSPIIETGDLHYKWSSTHHTSQLTPTLLNITSESKTARIYLYVFAYQNEDSNMLHQRLGCMHGEELAYLFGVPLAVQLLGRSIGHFASNYSKPEVTLSEAVMTYWINFAKFGDPNIGHHELHSHSSATTTNERTKGRFESVIWPQYDSLQRKYLMIGMKPKVRDHYHSHRLSFWLHLIPQLHQPGEEDIYLRHHLLLDHENPSSYDGIVRQIAFKFLQPLPTATLPVGVHAMSPAIANKRLTTMSSIGIINNDNSVLNHESIGGISVIDDRNTNKTTATAMVMNENGYTTALSVTIAIGCSLLILNMLIFAGVYYQLDRAKSRSDAAQPKRTHTTTAASGHNHHHHYHHQHHNDDSLTPEETSLMLSSSSPHTNSSSIMPSSSSPISTLLAPAATVNLNQKTECHHHNVKQSNALNSSSNSGNVRTLRAHTFGKMSKLSLESVPEQTAICSAMPLHHCSTINYDNGDDNAGCVQMNHITFAADCVERNHLKI